jgi:hypothetical protein
VRAHTVRLELLSTKVQGAVAVVDADLQQVEPPQQKPCDHAPEVHLAQFRACWTIHPG